MVQSFDGFFGACFLFSLGGGGGGGGWEPGGLGVKGLRAWDLGVKLPRARASVPGQAPPENLPQRRAFIGFRV